MTITAAVPRPEPASRRASKSIIRSSHSEGGRQGTDEPPGITAFSRPQPPRTPPQWRSISSRRGIDMDSSTTQGCSTWPEMAKILVPVLFARPMPANQSPPRRRISGTTAMVSTLFTVVGQPYSPELAGNGGFSRGMPLRPSRDSSSPVSSPQI